MPPVPSIPKEYQTAPAATNVAPPPQPKPEAKGGFMALFSKFKGKKAKAEAPPPLPTPPSSVPSSSPTWRDESSGELPKTKAEIKAEEKAEKRRSKAAVKAAKRQSQSAAQVYATTYMTTSQRAAMALDKTLDNDKLKVEKVKAPASVHGVLLDMQRSSAVIERRATIRRQSLQLQTDKHASVVSSKTGHSVAAPTGAAAARKSRRVPVPTFEPDESEPMPMPGDRPAPMDLEVSPEAAAAARAAALARLEGKPSQRTPVSEDEHAHILVSNLVQSNDGHVLRTKPSLQSISEKPEATAPLRTKPSLRKIDTVDILQVNAAAIPLPRSPIADRTEPATQVPNLSDIVRPKHTGASPAGMPSHPVTRGLWTTEPDEMEGAEPLLPTSQRSFNTFPRSATGPTLRRTKPSLRNLHKSSPYDRSADASSDETHDVVRPLDIRIVPRSATFGPCSNLNEPATPSSFEHAASENGHASSAGVGSMAEHRSAAVRRYGSLLGYGHSGTPERTGWTATHAVPSLLGHGSSLGHGTFLDSAPPSPMGPRTPPDSHDGDHETSTTATTPTTKSKWRKSAQSLSRKLSTKTSATSVRAASLSRKLSTKPKEPPTSYDAYEAKQRELATRRRSCNPTVHDNASLQAEISEVRDKEEVRVAETFFLS